MPYGEVNHMLDSSFPRLALNYWKSCFIEVLSDAVIGILTARFGACPSQMSKIVIETPHGEALRRPADATAFPRRSPGFSILILAQWASPGDSDANIAWARETHASLSAHAGQGVYSNYLGDDEAPSVVRAAFGANLARLQALKDLYDPENIFRLNQNIPPTGR